VVINDNLYHFRGLPTVQYTKTRNSLYAVLHIPYIPYYSEFLYCTEDLTGGGGGESDHVYSHIKGLGMHNRFSRSWKTPVVRVLRMGNEEMGNEE
jgi:hypothetical protein